MVVSRRSSGVLALLLVGLLLVGFAALAAPASSAAADDLEADDLGSADVETTDLQVDVRRASLDEGGRTELIVNVSGPARPPVLDRDAFVVREGEQRVVLGEVEPLIGSETVRIITALSVDESESMGRASEDGIVPLEAVQDATADLVRSLTAQQIPVGLQAFANEPRVLSPPTTDASSLLGAIEGLEADLGTALFDAVVFGVRQLQAVEQDAIRSLVVLADGQDNRSSATIEEAIEVANEAAIPVTVVAFETDTLDFEALEPLAEETGGRFLMATEADQLAGIFDQIAQDVASQYTLAYEPSSIGPDELTISVEIDTGEAQAATSFVVFNPRTSTSGPLRPAELFDAGPLGSPVALYSALGVAFLSLVLVLLALFVPRGDVAVTRTLRSGLTMVQRAPEGAPRVTGLSASAIGRRAMEVVEAVPTPPGYEDRIQGEIDRAGWVMRASEFIAIRYGVAIGTSVLLWAISGRWWLGLLGLVLGAVAPRVVLNEAKRRRKQRFMQRLPDTLHLLSGTLRAGYGVLQAIDTVVKETEPPMSTEFQRVLTEARLGLDLEDSLAAMAERIDDDDFRWVVVAMNIQRRVGGNLAELLETVAGTLRGREQVRRQVDVLTAEGRLSAIVLVTLPFLILGYLLFTNPSYLAVLFWHPIGVAMLVGSGILMVLGVIWMRRLIRIEV